MKKLILFVFLLLAVILFLLLSCTHDVKQKGVSFDKTEFTAQKEKWNSAQIKNYSFDYSFGSYRPDYIVGNVTVTEDNKKANVVCTEESEKYSSGYKLDNTSKYYLDSIEDIFATPRLIEKINTAVILNEAYYYYLQNDKLKCSLLKIMIKLC